MTPDISSIPVVAAFWPLPAVSPTASALDQMPVLLLLLVGLTSSAAWQVSSDKTSHYSSSPLHSAAFAPMRNLTDSAFFCTCSQVRGQPVDHGWTLRRRRSNSDLHWRPEQVSPCYPRAFLSIQRKCKSQLQNADESRFFSCRNRTVGLRLGKGETLEQITNSMGGAVAEGVLTSRSACHLAEKLGIDCPTISGIYKVMSTRI